MILVHMYKLMACTYKLIIIISIFAKIDLAERESEEEECMHLTVSSMTITIDSLNWLVLQP
jgi:hypothetical protein